MDEPRKEAVLPRDGGIAFCVVLALLYLRFVLRDWHSLHELRGMILPFVVYGLFAGMVTTVLPWIPEDDERAKTQRIMATCAAIAGLAILTQILLMCAGLPISSGPGALPPALPQLLYALVAVGSVASFACVAFAGRCLAALVSDVLPKILPAALQAKSGIEPDEIKAIVGLLGALVTALFAGP